MKKFNVYFSEKNKKLQPSRDVRWAIWSLPAIVTCPFATEHCKASCYAVKAERQFPDCLPCRHRNLAYSKSEDFIAEVVRYIDWRLNTPSVKKAKKLIVRIHESGDFYSRTYFKKWLAIARHFSENKKVLFMAYTKSVNFICGESVPDNFILRFSVWDDTYKSDIDTACKLGLPIYTAVEKFTEDNTTEKQRCRCADCATCLKCYSNRNAYIACEIH